MLFNNWYKDKLFFWGMTVLTVVISLFPFMFHEVLGSNDYLYPKMYVYYPMVFFCEVGLTYGCRDIPSNRLMRSIPRAKELYTISVPLFITVMVVGMSAIMLTAYFIFLSGIGAEETQFSDTLICGAVLCLPLLVLSPFAARVQAGGALMVFFLLIPAIVVMSIGGEKVLTGGFGLSLWAAALIFSLSLAVGIFFAFLISAVRYKKSNVKISGVYLPVD